MIKMHELRLSAQRAFLGRITPAMRLVKAETVDGTIVITCLIDQPPTEVERELVSIAASEIVSDFPTANIREVVSQHTHSLPNEDVLAHGWIFERHEGVE